MSEQLLSDARHAELMKAAEETIGLMNLPGIDPDAALTKVAADHGMNDNEVELVAHAVNNSSQLAHLQDSRPEDREKPFPLIDSEKVKSTLDQQPATNADQFTGSRYGTQEERPETALLDAEKGRDAIQIKDQLDKKSSFIPKRQEPDYEAVLRAGWGLSQQKVAAAQVPQYTDPNARARILTKLSHAIEELRTLASGARTKCAHTLDAIAVEVRKFDAPKWSHVEKIAWVNGVEPAFLDLCHNRAEPDRWGSGERADFTKVAHPRRIYATDREQALAAQIIDAHRLFKQSADHLAAMKLLQEKQAALSPPPTTMNLVGETTQLPSQAATGQPVAGDLQDAADILPKPDTTQLQGETPQSEMAEADELEPAGTKIAAGGIITNVDPGTIGKSLQDVPQQFFATPETLTDAFGEAGEAGNIQSILGQDVRQNLHNVRTQDRLQELMQDEVIGSYSIPDVVDAFNQALSVNPNFGHAELVSYIRHHLATQGGVGLDLQIRARPKPGLRPGLEEDES